jgi:hypothetical protein
MSAVSDALARGLSALATAKGEALAYQAGVSGGFTALTGFVLIQQRVPDPSFSESDEQEQQVFNAVLKGPATPALAVGYQIQDTVTSYVWAVRSIKNDVQQVCMLERTKATNFTPNRGGA